MTVERFYKIEAVVSVPLEHRFPEEIRQACYLRLKGDITTSDLLLEEIRAILLQAGLPIESLSAGMIDWRVSDEKTGAILRGALNQ